MEGLRDGVLGGGFDRGRVEGGGAACRGGQGEVEALSCEDVVGVGEFGLLEGGVLVSGWEVGVRWDKCEG